MILFSLSTGLLLAADSISPAQLKQRLFTGEELLLLDVRGRQLSTVETLPGAMHGGSDPAGYLPDNRGGELVLITGKSTTSSQLVAWVRRLEQANFHVFTLQGGLEAWKASGGTLVNSGENYYKPGSLPFIIPRGLCEANEPAQVFQ